MILDGLLVIGLVVSAFLAVYLDEAIYAVLSLATMNVILSIFYLSLETPFAAVFQLAMGVGTVAVLFLTGQMLATRVRTAQTLGRRLLGLMVGVLLSVPSIVALGYETTVASGFQFTFSTALWELRAIDVMAQGLVILTVAIGITMVLKEKQKEA